MRNRYLGVLAALYFVVQVCAQALPTDGPLTLRPMCAAGYWQAAGTWLHL